MWTNILLMLVPLVLVGVTTATNASCGGTLTKSTGQIIVTTKTNQTKGENCTWYIVANQTTPQVMLLFNILNIPAKGDNLTIYAGNATNSPIITNFYNRKGSQMVISQSNITKIVLVRSQEEEVTVTINMTYNTKNCSQTMVGSRGVITSPIYLNGTGSFKCTYNLSMPTNQDVVVLSFGEVQLPNASVLVSVNKMTTNVTGTSLPDDVVGGPDTKTVTLTLNVTNSSLPQRFRAVYQNYDPVCSGTFSTDNETVFSNLSQPSSNQFPVSCYAQLVSSIKTSQVYVQNPYYGGLGAGADSVLFIDGGSRQGTVLGSANTKLSWFVSSGSMMTVVGNYGPSDGPRNPVRYRADSLSKFYTVSNKTQKIDIKVDASFQFQTDLSRQLLFSMNRATTSLTDGVVSLYDDQNNLLYTFRKNTAIIPIPSPGPRLLVTLSGMSDKQMVSLAVQQKTSDCNQLLQASSGQFCLISRANQSMCNSVISSGESLTLKLDGLDTLRRCNLTTLEVYQGYNSTSPFVTFSGNFTSAPPIKFPMGSPPRLVVKGPMTNNCSAVYIHAVYWKDNSQCVWPNTTSGVITSPAYPNQYPVYSGCNLTLPSLNNSMVFFSVKDILLAPQDNVTIQTRGASPKVLARFNGTSLPPDVILPNSNLSAVFTTGLPVNWMNPGQGFSLTYKILTCGGLQNQTGTNISSPSNLTVPVECVWIIQVPMNGTKKSVNILSLNITVNGSSTAGGNLTIYDGASIRDPKITLNLTKKIVPTILSRTNVIIVQYVYTPPKVKGTNLKAEFPFTFKLNYTTYNCNSSSQCDNGLCLHPDWRCNGKDDCGDGTDERNCNGTKPIPPSPAPPAPQCDGKRTGVAPYVVVVMLFLGLVLGVLIVVFTPKIIRKIRARSYQSNSNYGSLHEDT